MWSWGEVNSGARRSSGNVSQRGSIWSELVDLYRNLKQFVKTIASECKTVEKYAEILILVISSFWLSKSFFFFFLFWCFQIFHHEFVIFLIVQVKKIWWEIFPSHTRRYWERNNTDGCLAMSFLICFRKLATGSRSKTSRNKFFPNEKKKVEEKKWEERWNPLP